MDKNELLKRLGIDHPVILAPMGGGPGAPELVAAVSNAGGLGSLGAAYLKPSEITDAVRRIRELTDRPFAVNLFAGAHSSGKAGDAEWLSLWRGRELPGHSKCPPEKWSWG